MASSGNTVHHRVSSVILNADNDLAELRTKLDISRKIRESIQVFILNSTSITIIRAKSNLILQNMMKQ